MNRKMSKVLGVILALAMLVSVMPVTAVFATSVPADEGVNYGYRDIGYSAPALSVPTPNRGTLPAKYDGRTAGHQYTKVKDQGGYGTCWAHAMTAAVETSLIRQGYADTDIDLSELQLATATYGNAHDEMGLLGNDKTIPADGETALDVGGNCTMSAMSLARWTGSASENTMKYDEDARYTLDDDAVFSEDYYYGFDEAHLYRYYSVSTKNVSNIKQLIMEYGIAITSFYSSSSYMNSSTGAYYNNYYTTTNHEITVIGWDDNYSVSNFNSSARPSNNGAWLVRNSWGEDSGLDGYIWISYEDVSLKDSFGFVEVVPADTWDYNYQYDGAFSLNYNPVVLDILHNSNGVANIYTATSHQYLKSVCISFMESTNITISLKVFVNPSGKSFFKNDTPAYSGTYTTTYAGIYTFNLNTPVELQEGDDFAVYYKIISTSAISPYYEYSTTTSWDWVSFTEDKTNARSYGCGSDSITKLGDGVYRIKAYTVDADLARPTGFAADLAADGTVTLSWNAVTGATEYEIYSGTDVSEYALKAVTAATTISFPETDDNGIVLKYKVRAKNATQTGNFCNARTVRFDRKYSVSSLSLSPVTVLQGKTTRVDATIRPSYANDIMVGYTVDDESIATVTPDGKVTGVNLGTTTVTGVTRNGTRTAYATVTVTDKHTCEAGAPVTENTAPSSCTAAGGYDTVIYCSICGEELSRTRTETDVSAHTPAAAVKENETASTCSENGGYDTVIRCSVCNCVISSVRTLLPLTTHTAGKAVKENVQPATCLEDGSYDTVIYCTVCGGEISRNANTTDATGHTPYTSRAAKAATCGSDGNTVEISCKTCKTILTASQTIPATGTHTAGKVTVENKKYASCTEDGGYDNVIYCTGCHLEMSREHITEAAHGHLLYVTAAGTPATCNTAGVSDEKTCRNCGKIIERATAIPATGAHTAASPVKENETASTCTTAGTYDSVCYCKDCGTEISRTQETKPLGAHSPTTSIAAVAATCTTAGNTAETSCRVCGAIITKAKEIPALGHDLTGYKGLSPTCTEKGYNGYTACKRCDYTTKTEIPALGHDLVTTEGIPATCTTTGFESYVSCTRCDYTTYKATPKTAHDYADGTCTMCGQADPASTDAPASCTHLCHQSGFMGFIWKIINIFNKMFKSNQYCPCGAAHW